MSLFKEIEADLMHHKLQILYFDHHRPWRGFFVIKEEEAKIFSDIYFEEFDVEGFCLAGKLSPKQILVKPYARLS